MAGRTTHNFGTVVAFELRRTLKRPTFWVMTLSVPLLLIAVTMLVLFSNNRAFASADDAPTSIPFVYTDASGLIDPAIAAAAGGVKAVDAAAATQARDAVVNGKAELFVAYPADPTKQPVEVVGRDLGMTSSVDYSGLASGVLIASAKAKVPDATVASVLTVRPSVHEVRYADGQLSAGIAGAILPGAFIVLFYMAIVMLGNQMLNITVEEKENRVTEMILTTIRPTTLILGKLTALVMIGFVQAAVLVGPMLAIPAVVAPMMPKVDETGASVSAAMPSMAALASAMNPGAVALGLVLFIGSFLLFTGLLVSIGAIMPTAKDAGAAFGGIVIALFLPFYAFGVIMADPHGVASEVLTFFPLTAPVTAMARNATGTLNPWETVVVLVVIYGCAAALLALGVRLFRTGSISYNARLDVGKVLGFRRSKA